MMLYDMSSIYSNVQICMRKWYVQILMRTGLIKSNRFALYINLMLAVFYTSATENHGKCSLVAKGCHLKNSKIYINNTQNAYKTKWDH